MTKHPQNEKRKKNNQKDEYDNVHSYKLTERAKKV